jgi:hypothetical protein
MPPDLITRIRRAPRRVPCPRCGRLGRRRRLLHRRVRTLAYRRSAWLEVIYAEYRARCGCRKYLRTWPLGVPAKAAYDATVRQAVRGLRLRLPALSKGTCRRSKPWRPSESCSGPPCLRWIWPCGRCRRAGSRPG